MAGEKKTLKTRLIQVGSQKFDAPYSLADLIITTDGKTVKEILDEFDVEIGNPKDVDNNIEATGLYKLIEDKTIDTSTLQLKEDNSLITTDKTVVGAIAEIINEYLGSKKLIYLTQAEYDLLSDSDKNDTTKVYNITDAVEKDYQEKEDTTLNTDDKTIVGAINEVDTKVDNIKTEIGKKKVPGTPEVVEEYVTCLQTDDGALEVVADGSVTNADTQIELTTANSLGGSFSIGEYVKHVPHVDAVPEVPGTGMYKFVEDSINQALVGGEVDLSGYQEKVDNNLITDDKNLVNVINALADDSHYHEAFTDAEIENMFENLTPEEVQMYQNLIDDNSISTNRIYSSSKVKDLITEALLNSQQYADNLVGAMNSMTAKVVPQLPDTGQELVLYLVGDSSSGYTMHMYIEGAFVELGSMNIDLTDYVKTDDMNTALTDKADDNKVVHVDSIKTALSDVPSNANVLSELAVKNLLDGKADNTSIPTKTSQLTNDSGFLTEHQDLSDYAKTVDLPTPRTDKEIQDLADGQISKNQKNQLKDYYVKVVSNTDMSDFGIDDLSTLTSLLDLTKVLGYHVRFTIQVNAGATSTLFNSNVIPVDKAGLLILTCEYARGSAIYHTYDNIVYASSTDNSTTIEWRLWKKVLTDTDLTQTIDSSSTDSQIASAKSVYTRLKGTRIHADNISTYGTEILKYPIGKWIIVTTSVAEQFTDLPTKLAGIIEIETIDVNDDYSPWKDAFAHKLYTYTTYNNDTYIRKISSGITAGTITIDTGWKKLCTTKVPDVDTTVTTFENADVSGYVKYYVKNGICHVTFWPVQSTSTGTGKKLLSNMPIPLGDDTGTALFHANGDGTSTAFSYVNSNGNLYAHFYKANTASFGTFSYPVAES